MKLAVSYRTLISRKLVFISFRSDSVAYFCCLDFTQEREERNHAYFFWCKLLEGLHLEVKTGFLLSGVA